MKTNDKEVFEGVYIGIRGELRLLRGKLDTYLSIERPAVVEGFTPAEVKSLREMRKLVNRAIGVLDRYEDMDEHYAEMERQTEWLYDLTRRIGSHEGKGQVAGRDV